jgi:ubiquinone/menaquinone biosynthesis C-methylase UbiE
MLSKPLSLPAMRLVAVLAAASTLCGTTAVAQKTSVRPGINKSFENPNVAQFVERFEREGREIYEQRTAVVDACDITPGMAIADIGAGTGLFTRLFAARVGSQGRVYAVDIARKFVEHIERTCREQKLTNVTGVVCGHDSVDLPANSLDVAFICDTYHHFEYPHKTMRSIHRALRTGGALYVIDFQRIEGKSSNWILKHVRAGKEVFCREIEAAGFKLVEEKPLFKQNYFLKFRKSS